jgi:hypothetical protein
MHMFESGNIAAARHGMVGRVSHGVNVVKQSRIGKA